MGIVRKTQLIFVYCLEGPCTFDAEPVGRWFRAWWYHHNRSTTLSGEGHSFAESGTQSDEEEEISTVEIEDDVNYLRSLDPKEWKVRFKKESLICES